MASDREDPALFAWPDVALQGVQGVGCSVQSAGDVATRRVVGNAVVGGVR